MPSRPSASGVVGGAELRARGPVTARRWTTVDPRTPWTSLVVWFLAALDLGRDVSTGYVGIDPGRAPGAVRIATGDGSWAEVGTERDTDGAYPVTEGGPRSLWRLVEAAHQLWADHDRFSWPRLGLTVTPISQTLWLDDPDGGRSWLMPTTA